MSTKTTPLGETSAFVIEPWNVILLNDDWHTFDEVIMQVMKATGCSLEQATEITWHAHVEGEAVCYTGPRERCEHVASILEEIELGVRLERV
ncbi:MAG: ATP-dependent Clp protease adaptor ClpS [Nitrospirae bacterium]|nr:ATP-dependent Clp protease adaptor ClpS [Nitrospirota bacterium]